MSGRTPEDFLTVVHRDYEESNCASIKSAHTTDEFLSDASPRHKPWDDHRAESDEIAGIFARSDSPQHQAYASRMDYCAQVLEFARDPPTSTTSHQKLKFVRTYRCHVRHCAVCQWRRAMQWKARFYQALPQLMLDYPDARFLFLTLTVRNCDINELRSTLLLLARAWQRLTQLQVWPAIGWIRATEITRSQKDRSAHPHFHVLLMVRETYFTSAYLTQAQWVALWRQCLRINYNPIVDIQVIRQSRKRSRVSVNRVNISQMWAIVTEILKYTVKPSDMIRDHEWFLQLVNQIHKMRAVAVGGVLKSYLRARKRAPPPEEPWEESPEALAKQLFFSWKQTVRRYRRRGE